MPASLWRDEDGLIHVEHAILLALLVVGGILVWTLLGGRLRWVVSGSSNAFATAAGVGASTGDTSGFRPAGGSWPY
jgi:Flp pilus assembly pilin Flp